MSGLDSGSVYISVPRVKKTFNASNGVGLQTFINSLDADTKYVVEIDGIVDLTDEGAGYVNLSVRQVEFVPATEGSGFQFSDGFFLFGTSNWTMSTRGTALTAHINAGSCTFTIPAGVTLAVGDYVMFSSDDTRTNCIFSGSGLRPLEVKRIGYITGSTGYVTKPFEQSLTTTNNARILKPLYWGKDIEFNGLSFYNNASVNTFGIGPIRSFKVQNCTFVDPAPGGLGCVGGEAVIHGNKWLQGLSKTIPVPYGVVASNVHNFRVTGNQLFGWYHEWFTTSSHQEGGYHWDYCEGIVEDNTIEGVADVATGGWLTDAAIDTHPEGSNITIKNNKIHVVGREGVVITNCIRVRSRLTNVVGNDIRMVSVAETGLSHAGTGITIQGGGCIARNNTIRNGLHAISVSPYIATKNAGTMPKIIIDHNTCIGQLTSAVKIFTGESSVDFQRLEISHNTFTENRGGGFSGSPDCHIDNQREAGSAPMDIFGNTFQKSSASHDSIYTNYGTSDVNIVGNRMTGFGSGSMGLGGSTAATLNTAYAAKNYVD